MLLHHHQFVAMKGAPSQPSDATIPASNHVRCGLGCTEWRPTSSPAGCVVGILSTDLWVDSWATFAVELAVNYAALQHYSYTLFDERHQFANATVSASASGKASLFWSKPHAILELLERRECPWVLYHDADAIINNPEISIQQALAGPYLWQEPRVRVLLACHSPFGSGGDCQPCRCCRAGRCPADARRQLPANDGSWVNAGVVLVRGNDGMSQEMMQWWASSGGGECSARTPPGLKPRRINKARDAKEDKEGRTPMHYFAEQACLQRLQRRWVSHVDVLNAAAFNAPMWYNPAMFRWMDLKKHGLEAASKFLRQEMRNVSSKPCLHSKLFICHAYGQSAEARAEMLAPKVAELAPLLGALLRRRGQPYQVQPTRVLSARRVRCLYLIKASGVMTKSHLPGGAHMLGASSSVVHIPSTGPSWWYALIPGCRCGIVVLVGGRRYIPPGAVAAVR